MTGYITIAGDTWDKIAKAVYDDESYTSFLMENNQHLLDYFVFPEGIEVTIADRPEEEDALPDWRT